MPKDRVRVLIADDHPMFAELVMRVLCEYDWIDVIGCARNGLEAVELEAEYEPDLVLMDVEMPVMDGFEATRRITARGGAPVLMLTGTTSAADVARARAAGAAGFVSKSVESAHLVARVQQVSAEAGTREHSASAARAQA